MNLTEAIQHCEALSQALRAQCKELYQNYDENLLAVAAATLLEGYEAQVHELKAKLHRINEG